MTMQGLRALRPGTVCRAVFDFLESCTMSFARTWLVLAAAGFAANTGMAMDRAGFNAGRPAGAFGAQQQRRLPGPRGAR